jgi:monofunctional biosynthetic peptidoglycan transglycosylase
LLSAEGYPETVVERALAIADEEPSDKAAWTLRYAMDEVYLNSLEGSDMNKSMFRLDMSQSQSWYAVNDNVMGGISRGFLKLSPDGIGIFSGQLSLANNGGFSSVRTEISKGGLTGADGLEIKIKGDDRKYSILLGTDEMRGSWQASFVAGKEWNIVRIPFEKFRLSVRGWSPPSAPLVPKSRISTIGIIIGDKDERPFKLQIDSITGYVRDTAL